MRISKTNILIIALSLAVMGMAGAIYRQFTAEQRAEALGDLAKLSAKEKVVYTDPNDGTFHAKVRPGASDWLAQHNEPGQTFTQYLRSSPNLPNKEKNVLYIQPLGDFPKETTPDLQTLLEYTKAYYYPMKVVMQQTIPAEKVKATKRVNGGRGQWLTRDILNQLYSEYLPEDAYSVLAVTMTDLYPKPEWNFVFGMASLKHRVGVFSFARYIDKDKKVTLKRAAKVLTHETGHMFGIKHCIFYQCNMGGANHLGEMDASPMHLCPVCLRKLQHSAKFKPLERYQKLYEFYEKYGLNEEAKWVAARMKVIRSVK